MNTSSVTSCRGCLLLSVLALSLFKTISVSPHSWKTLSRAQAGICALLSCEGVTPRGSVAVGGVSQPSSVPLL